MLRSIATTGLKVTGLLGIGSCIRASTEHEPPAQQQSRNPKQVDRITTIQDCSELSRRAVHETKRALSEALRNPTCALLRTIAESIAEFYTGRFASTALKERGYRTGNVGYPDTEIYDESYGPLIRHTVEASALVVAAPFAEEIAFRLLPTMAWISKQDVSDRWDVGIASALAFAYMHNIEQTNVKIGNLVFPMPTGRMHIQSIPINQFVLGIYTWFAMRRRGFSHAMLAHSIHNLVALITREKAHAPPSPLAPQDGK